ncbi:hypothetical protein [Pyrodictium abyssi]|uniref:Uncharacterized protein n=1 Tax=Pyrodictium abyssi TaxID=54256 RepID=A0ABM8IXD8_9CREN|nr:hypothetical protein PABY_17770 [Pyrodictium abyssi]
MLRVYTVRSYAPLAVVAAVVLAFISSVYLDAGRYSVDSLLGYLIDTAPKGARSSATVTLATPCACNVSVEVAVGNVTVDLVNGSASFVVSVACSGANTSCLECLGASNVTLVLRIGNTTLDLLNTTHANASIPVEMSTENATEAVQRLVYPYVEEELQLLEARVAAEPPAKNATRGTLVVTVKAGGLNVSWPGLLAGSSLSVEEAGGEGNYTVSVVARWARITDYYSYRVTRLASLAGSIALPALLMAIPFIVAIARREPPRIVEGVGAVLAAALALFAPLAAVFLLDRPGVEAAREAPSFTWILGVHYLALAAGLALARAAAEPLKVLTAAAPPRLGDRLAMPLLLVLAMLFSSLLAAGLAGASWQGLEPCLREGLLLALTMPLKSAVELLMAVAAYWLLAEPGLLPTRGNLARRVLGLVLLGLLLLVPATALLLGVDWLHRVLAWLVAQTV